MNSLADVLPAGPERWQLQLSILEMQQLLVREHPEDTLLSMSLAVSYAWFGMRQKHEELCRQLLQEAVSVSGEHLDRADKVAASEQLDRAAKAWLIRPTDQSNLTPLAIRLARRAYDLNQQHAWMRMGAGIAAYREGRYEVAKRLLDTRIDHNNLGVRSPSLAFLAMTHFRGGQIEKARETLAANQRYVDMTINNGAINVPDIVITWLAHQEAQTLLEPDSSTLPSGNLPPGTTYYTD
jgi:hypothetical protein